MVHICVFAATQRGLIFLRKLHSILPDARLTVVSFKEEDHEPPFLEDIRSFSGKIGATFFAARNVALERYSSLWESLSIIDLMFCVSWRYLIPPSIYERARIGTFVFHDSMLPKYRGFAPSVWSIVNGESHTGASLILISEGIDEGDIVDQESVKIDTKDNIADVLEKVTKTYLTILERNIAKLLSNKFSLKPQNHNMASYTVKRTTLDYKLDWMQPAKVCYDLIRGCTRPYPGAYTFFNGMKLVIFKANLSDSRVYEVLAPGRVTSKAKNGISVLCGDKRALFLEEFELETKSGEIATFEKILGEIQLSTTFT